MSNSKLEDFEFHPIYSRQFFGRELEQTKLRNYFLDGQYSFRPIWISGAAGVGKTALVSHVIASSRLASTPYLINLELSNQPKVHLQEFIQYLYKDHQKGNFIVIVDGADVLSDDDVRSTTSQIFNIKATCGLAFIGRYARNLERGENLKLDNFDTLISEYYLAHNLESDVDRETLLKAINVAKGNPLALGVLVNALSTGGYKSFQDIISGQLYEISNGIAVPKENIIEIVRPKLISSTDYLVEKLRKQPQHVYEISPRKFEELLAELLTDMGWDVELTKETRDGGKDILAYLNTDLGRMLCLVEAKRYRHDRKIGVGLVRSLYGSLCDHNASSAMIVTTSTFTSDAKEFQKKYEYQLSLRDFGDLNQWIHAYKR